VRCKAASQTSRIRSYESGAPAILEQHSRSTPRKGPSGDASPVEAIDVSNRETGGTREFTEHGSLIARITPADLNDIHRHISSIVR